jgi:hypothetical protein
MMKKVQEKTRENEEMERTRDGTHSQRRRRKGQEMKEFHEEGEEVMT